MDENEILSKPKNRFPDIIITQAVCVIIILLTLTVMKYFFKGHFKKIEKWYNLHICSDTNISEILSSDGGTDEN
ncbi:MAG: hypothetical protein IKD04_10155 [Clostridia bacterium]|nr:hypothetical protein [Clostridia bacterium]